MNDQAFEAGSGATEQGRLQHILRQLRDHLVAHDSDTVLNDRLKLVDDALSLLRDSSSTKRQESVMLQYDSCLEVCRFLNRTSLDCMQSACRFFRDVVTEQETKSLCLGPLLSADLRVDDFSYLLANCDMHVSVCIKHCANEDGLVSAVEFEAPDVTRALAKMACFLRTSFCVELNINFGHSLNLDDLGFDARLVAKAFAPMAGSIVVDRLRLDIMNATPQLVTGFLDLVDYALSLEINFGRMSPADFSQELFAFCVRKRVGNLKFIHDRKLDPHWSPVTLMQAEDIVTFCFAEAPKNSMRRISARYANKSTLLAAVVQHVIHLSGNECFEFVVDDVSLDAEEALAKYLLRETDGIVRVYVISDLKNQLNLEISVDDFFGSVNVSVCRKGKNPNDD